MSSARVRVIGVAKDAKAGAIVMHSKQVIYVDGLDAWPSDVLDKSVCVSGISVKKGAEGDQMVLERPVWTISKVATPLLIRHSIEADVGAFAAIYAPAVTHGVASFELTAPDEAEMRKRRETIVNGGYPWLAAELDGEVVGYAYAGAYRTRPAYRFTVEDSIYIKEGFRKRGIGQALLTVLLDVCEKAGFRQMMGIMTSEVKASEALHALLGFKLVGTTHAVGWKFGRWLDVTTMQLPLGPGSSAPPTETSRAALEL